MKKNWFVLLTVFFIIVNITVPSVVKDLNYFSDTTTETTESENETEPVEEVEKELFHSTFTPTLSVLITDYSVTWPVKIFISSFLSKIFVPPSL